MDKITAKIRSRNMSRIKSKDTMPELIIRKLLVGLGKRYRIHYPLPGKPDIVFLSKKIALFIHGCYWHGHGCKVDHVSKSNTEFWNNKITKNKKRDKENIKKLRREGWKIIIIWECKIRKDQIAASKKLLNILSIQ